MHLIPGYLVLTPQCEIAEVTPKDSPVTKIFNPLKPKKCSKMLALSAIVYNKERTVASLVLFGHRVGAYSTHNRVMCQYQRITINDKDKLQVRSAKLINLKGDFISNQVL